MPAESKLKTTSAVLRSIIELKDKEMADLLDCSVNTIWSLESGRLKLSESMALRMSSATGISTEWLLRGDSKAAPLNGFQEPFTKMHFIIHVGRGDGNFATNPQLFSYLFAGAAFDLRRVLHAANKMGHTNYAILKVDKALRELQAELKLGLSPTPRDVQVASIIRQDLERFLDYSADMDFQDHPTMKRINKAGMDEVRRIHESAGYPANKILRLETETDEKVAAKIVDDFQAKLRVDPAYPLKPKDLDKLEQLSRKRFATARQLLEKREDQRDANCAGRECSKRPMKASNRAQEKKSLT